MGDIMPIENKIELRITNIDPPESEPKRTTYVDLVNLPDPVKFGWTVKAFNHDDVALYFQITGQGSGYTFETVNLGSIDSGSDLIKNLDEFASKSKPASEQVDNITLILKAYTDAGYTDLKWQFPLSTQVVFIKSDDASYTVDYLHNFDDGTVQGWAIKNGLWEDLSGTLEIGVATDYVLSTPYSLKGSSLQSIAGGSGTVYSRCLRIVKDADILLQLGEPLIGAGNLIPQNRWLRIVVPLPKNVTFELDVELMSYGSYVNRDDFMLYKNFTTPNKAKIYAIIDLRMSGSYQVTTPKLAYLWLDDFKIISKD